MASAAQRSRGHRDPPEPDPTGLTNTFINPQIPPARGAWGFLGSAAAPARVFVTAGARPAAATPPWRRGRAVPMGRQVMVQFAESRVLGFSFPSQRELLPPCGTDGRAGADVLSPQNSSAASKICAFARKSSTFTCKNRTLTPKPSRAEPWGRSPGPGKPPGSASAPLRRKGQEQLLQETLQQERQWLWKHALSSALRWTNRLGTGGLRAAHRCPGCWPGRAAINQERLRQP